jgi:hypothetical protein
MIEASSGARRGAPGGRRAGADGRPRADRGLHGRARLAGRAARRPKTLAVNALAEALDCASSAHSPTTPHNHQSPFWRSALARYSPTSCWRTRSTAPPKTQAALLEACRAAGHGRRRVKAAARPVPRGCDPESDRYEGTYPLPRPSSIAFCSASTSATPTKGERAILRLGHRGAVASLEPVAKVAGADDLSAVAPDRRHDDLDEVTDYSQPLCARRELPARSSSARARARGGASAGSGARGARLAGRAFAAPGDVGGHGGAGDRPSPRAASEASSSATAARGDRAIGGGRGAGDANAARCGPARALRGTRDRGRLEARGRARHGSGPQSPPWMRCIATALELERELLRSSRAGFRRS